MLHLIASACCCTSLFLGTSNTSNATKPSPIGRRGPPEDHQRQAVPIVSALL